METTRAGLSEVEVDCLATAVSLDLELIGTEEEREKQVLDYLLPLFKPYINENGLIYDEWDYAEDVAKGDFTGLKYDIFPNGYSKLSSFASLSEWVKSNGWKALIWICLSANEGMHNTSQPMWC